MNNLEEQSSDQHKEHEQPREPPRFSIPKPDENLGDEQFSRGGFGGGDFSSEGDTTILSQYSEVRDKGLRVLESIESKYRKMVESLPKIALKMEMEQAFMETCEIVREFFEMLVSQAERDAEFTQRNQQLTDQMREFERLITRERGTWEGKERLTFDDVLFLGARRKELDEQLTQLKEVVEETNNMAHSFHIKREALRESLRSAVQIVCGSRSYKNTITRFVQPVKKSNQIIIADLEQSATKVINQGFTFPEKFACVQIRDTTYLSGGEPALVSTYEITEFVVHKLANMNHARRKHKLCAVKERHIFAIGGYDAVKRLTSVERYDIESNRWRVMAPMLHRRNDHAVCVYNDKWIYVFCGYDGDSSVDTVERYDIEADCWYQVSLVNASRQYWRPRWGIGAQQVSSNEILVFGDQGYTFFLTPGDENELKVVALATTLQSPSIRNIRWNQTVLNEKLFTFDDLGTLWSYSLKEKLWIKAEIEVNQA